jgi:hypothetical protein
MLTIFGYLIGGAAVTILLVAAIFLVGAMVWEMLDL